MPVKKDKPLKLFYSISEVAAMFHVSETLLRYWETEFPMIIPKKSKTNIRQYKKEDIDKIRLVYTLVKERGMTLAGAKQALRKNAEGTQNSVEAVRRLKEIRQELLEMKQELNNLA